MRRNKTDAAALAYRKKVLINKLETAQSLHSGATLDEWEASAVAGMLKTRQGSKAWGKTHG